MQDSVLPLLVACHRRVTSGGGSSYFRYSYGLLAFPVPGLPPGRAPFCLVAQRTRWPGPPEEGGSALGPLSPGAGRAGADAWSMVLREGGPAAEPVVATSRTFVTTDQEALLIFEQVAFAQEPVSPHHLDDVVEDVWEARGPSTRSAARPAAL